MKNNTDKPPLRKNSLRVTLPAAEPKKNRKAADKISIPLNAPQKISFEIEKIRREFTDRKTSMPQDIKPMLATITDKPFNHANWSFEIKWDGYRCLAYNNNGQCELRSRNNLSFTKKYAPIAAALQKWPVNAVLDGEIVVLSEDGHADFAALQHWDQEQHGQLFYWVYDLLWMDGIDLRNEPLLKRREVLKKIFTAEGPVGYSESIAECGIDFFAAAKQNGLEGIIAKENNATYMSGQRSQQWLKIKLEQRHEAVICGYTKNKDTERLFSSLVLGVPGDNGMEFIGQVGTGFSARSQREIFKKMNPLFVDACPFDTRPQTGAPTMWVKPQLVCEVKYTERTKDGLMRHPSFQGLREDKGVADFNSDKVQPKKLKKKSPKKIAEPIFKEEDSQTIKVDGHSLQLTNLTKIYWPKEKIKKGDLLNYYSGMAPYILPYMMGRPQSLNRFPNGVTGENFYQKNIRGKKEKWIATFERKSESDGEKKEFLVCDGEASLLYMANLGCIEMNPWHSRVNRPLHPDWCVIDLDPGDISFEKVIETARVVGNVLDSLHIPSFPKTSGSTGIHIYIPLGAKYSYDQSRQLAELIANLVHAELPAFTSLVRKPALRKDKIYIDYLQNREIQTICAPYSIRPKPGATASAPLHWDEVKKGLKISQFTIYNMAARVKAEGDLFAGVLEKSIDINSVLKKLTAAI